MKLDDFDFDLPDRLIAQEPIKDRSKSKLLVLDKANGNIEHKGFEDVIQYLKPKDCIVLNNTRVIPARLFGYRKKTLGKIEVVLLKPIDIDTWEVLAKPGRRAHKGDDIIFGDGCLTAKVLDTTDFGGKIVKFRYKNSFEKILDEIGQMPTPPYIKKPLQDKERYQTVYAENTGSVAAPTAGLHFTKELLKEIEKQDVSVAFITLHVGLGTFRPVSVKNIEEHKMHEEYYEISETTAKVINSTKKSGGKIFSVGTTSTRALESVADMDGKVKACKGWSNIYIYPGYKFKTVDCLLTNFHLPKSTLLMLVCALAGRERILGAYKEAIINNYKFFSFGDAMLIV